MLVYCEVGSSSGERSRLRTVVILRAFLAGETVIQPHTLLICSDQSSGEWRRGCKSEKRSQKGAHSPQSSLPAPPITQKPTRPCHWPELTCPQLLRFSFKFSTSQSVDDLQPDQWNTWVALMKIMSTESLWTCFYSYGYIPCLRKKTLDRTSVSRAGRIYLCSTQQKRQLS